MISMQLQIFISRDNYDKEVKQKEQEKQAHKPRRATKKQEQTIYVPPSKRDTEDAQSETFDDRYLFTFEYEDQHGRSHIVDILEVHVAIHV